jgi:hypothetical protein
LIVLAIGIALASHALAARRPVTAGE